MCLQAFHTKVVPVIVWRIAYSLTFVDPAQKVAGKSYFLAAFINARWGMQPPFVETVYDTKQHEGRVYRIKTSF